MNPKSSKAKPLLQSAAAAVLLGAADADSVAFVASFTSASHTADTISLLEGDGHTVTVVPAGDIAGTLTTTHTPSGLSKKAYLESFGLVMISRAAGSGNFTDKAGWAGLEVPVISLNPYAVRGTDRLHWFSGGTADPAPAAPDTIVANPDHPIWAGVTLTDSNTRANLFVDPLNANHVSGSVGTFANGTLLGTSAAGTNPSTIVVWEDGAQLASGNLAADRRVFFAGGGHFTFTDDGSQVGSNTAALNADGDIAFLNAVEWALTNDPNPDSDNDFLPDIWEIANFGNLDQTGSGDPDGDTFNNLAEFNASSNPGVTASVPGDIDGDAFADSYENQYFNSLTETPGGDFDQDFVTNAAEQSAGTLPNDARVWPDADADGMNDGWETAYGLNTAGNDSSLDPDSDGATNAEEHAAGTDPQDSGWSPANARVKHRWSFTNDLADSVGGSNAQIVDPDGEPVIGGTSTQGPTSITLSGGNKDQSDYVLLGNNLLSALQSGGPKSVTVELWATQNVVLNWSRIFSFGVSGSPGVDQELAMTWSTGTDGNNDRVLWNGRALADGTNAPYQLSVPYHVIMTIVPAVHAGGTLATGAQVTWYSAPASANLATGHPLFAAKGTFNVTGNLATIADSVCTLGRSMFPDATASAEYDEMRIWAGALTETERELFHLLGTDSIDRSDTDSDGFPDAWESTRFGNLTTAAVGADSDSDGDPDEAEFAFESDPNDGSSTGFDSDGDGLNDLGFEMQYFNHLLWSGSDDTDNDFISNADEQTGGSDPSDPDSSPDTDSDGLADGWEIVYFSDIVSQDGSGNPDGDLDDNATEYANLTDPTDEFSGSDSDEDGLPDYWETVFLGDFVTYDGGDDPDGDTVTNAAEFAAGTDPSDDTDFPDVNDDNIPDGHRLIASDGFGATSFNAGLNWDNAQAPAAGSNYLVFGQTIRTPDVDNAFTVFAGDKLVISNGALWLKGTNSTGSANYVLHFGTIRNAVSSPGPASVAGTIEVIAASELFANNGPLVVDAVVSGSADLNITGTNAVEFNAANTFAGDITLGATASIIVDGSLSAGPASVFNFAPAGSGVSNSIGGTGSVALNGVFNISLAGASSTPGSNWALVSTAAVTYDNAFTIVGFTPDGAAAGSRIWTGGTYEFSEASGVLSIPAGPGYFGWAATNGLTLGGNDGAEANPDSDPYANVLEYQLHGDPLASDDGLVTATADATHLIFTFERYDLSETDSTLNFRWGTNLAAWNSVAVGATSSGPNSNGVVVTVTEDGGSSADYDLIEVRLPKTNAAGGKLFGQLQGMQP